MLLNAAVVMNNLKRIMIYGWPENKADVLDEVLGTYGRSLLDRGPFYEH